MWADVLYSSKLVKLIIARKEDSLAVDTTVLRLFFAERSIQYGRPEVHAGAPHQHLPSFEKKLCLTSCLLSTIHVYKSRVTHKMN